MRWPPGGSRLTWAMALALVAGLFGVEAAYLGGAESALRSVAAYFWIGFSCLLLATAWAYSLSPFTRADFWRDPARWWYLLAYLLPPALVLVDAGGVRFTSLDFEGIRQLEIALRLLRQHDLGLYDLGYVGCLNRAAILNALPSCVLGRTLWAVRLGNSAIYLGSYGFFLAALARFLRHRGSAEAVRLAAYAGMVIGLGGFVIEVARKFEQTSSPIAYTLLFAGMLLLNLTRPSPLRFVALVWSFGVLPYVYTPALATWALGMAALLYLAWRERRWLLLVPAAYGAITLMEAMVITSRGSGVVQRFIVTLPDIRLSDQVWHVLTGLRVPISGDFSLIPPPLGLAVLGLLWLSWRRRERLFPLTCLWAAAVAFAAVGFIGSNYAYSPFSMHRSLMMVVPLALGVTLWASRLLQEAPERRWIVHVLNLSMAYMVLTSVSLPFTVRSFYGTGVESDEEEMMVDVYRLAQGSRPPTRILLAKNVVDLDQDAARYFVPGIEVWREADAPRPNLAGSYRFSYFADNPGDRFPDEIVPSHRPRPYVKVEPL